MLFHSYKGKKKNGTKSEIKNIFCFFLEKIISLKFKNRDKVADYLENIALISHLENQILIKNIQKK